MLLILMLLITLELTSTLTLILTLISVLRASSVIPCDGERAENADGDSSSDVVNNEDREMNMRMMMAHFQL